MAQDAHSVLNSADCLHFSAPQQVQPGDSLSSVGLVPYPPTSLTRLSSQHWAGLLPALALSWVRAQEEERHVVVNVLGADQRVGVRVGDEVVQKGVNAAMAHQHLTTFDVLHRSCLSVFFSSA